MAKALKQPKVRLAMAISQLIIALILIAVGAALAGSYNCTDNTSGTGCPSTNPIGTSSTTTANEEPCDTVTSGILAIVLGVVGLVSPILAIVNFKNMRPPFLAANLTCDILTSAFALVVGIFTLVNNVLAESDAGTTLCYYDGSENIVSNVNPFVDTVTAFALIGALVNLAALGLDSYEMHMLRKDDAFYCCAPDE